MKQSLKKRAARNRKPVAVTQATHLLWASLGAGVVVSLLDVSSDASASLDFTLTAIAVVLAITALLIHQISCGKNWARWVFLILFVAGLTPYLPNLIAMFEQSLTMGALALLQLIVQIVALYLIFSGPGSAWFRKKSANIRRRAMAL